ncbi:MAG TPA: Tm-1-like ATP-binding domain-containing protein, partial [Pirellula sp.]|nr:Tm-1-like ATP-binding domain-containing protein [Pirellula sp.]
MATIALLGTMDTKGEEHAFVAEQIKKRGHNVLVIDVGILAEPKLKPHVPREEVLSHAGISLPELLAKKDRGE